MKRACAICLFLLAAAAAGGSAPAAAESLFPPGGFRLPTSNGYSLHALAYDGDPRGDHDGLILFVGRKGEGVTYFVRRHVEVTETTIAADLGRLGSLDLNFVPSGRPTKQHSRCDPQQVEFDSGFYEGQIEFKGEEGYTEVHASRAPGELRVGLNLLCAGGPAVEGSGGNSPGARLRVRRHLRTGDLVLDVRANSPTRPAYFGASIEERSPGLAVIRGVAATGAIASFDYDVPARSARLAPPLPFEGVARFYKSGERRGRLHGRLTVDFPGRSDVSLSGARGSLSRYVANPSHPFRLFLSQRLERITARRADTGAGLRSSPGSKKSPRGSFADLARAPGTGASGG
jgi:hypothetical protein